MKLTSLRRWIEDPGKRVRLMQILTIVGTFRMIKANDPSIYDRYRSFAKPEFGSAPGWTPGRLRAVRPLVVLSGVIWLLKPRSKLAAAAFVTTSAVFQAETIRFHRPLWSYTNHLQGMSLVEALRLTSTDSSDESTDATLRAMELYLGSIYAQAAASKIIHGGPTWVSEASTVRASLSELGRPMFQGLIPYKRLMQGLAGSSLLWEAAVLPLTAFGGMRSRRIAAAGTLSFHTGVKTGLDISFWHLWWHLVPLLMGGRPKGSAAPWRRADGLVMLGMVGGNSVATILNRHWGPFCAYNMFFGVTPSEYPQLRVRVHREGGTSSEVLDVRGLMPFEFFRTVSMLEHVFTRPAGESDRKACAAAILDGLNDNPWGPRDEVNPSLRSASDARLTGFDLLIMRTSSGLSWRSQADDAARLQCLYSYRQDLARQRPHQARPADA